MAPQAPQGEGGGDEGMEEDDDDEDMEELMQNPEFLHSVLSSLPGVNPEEALHNIEQITEQQQQKEKKDVKVRV